MFRDLCATRYSCRSYTSQPVEPEKMQYIMECVRLAPSAVNRQPWRFVVVDDERRQILYRAYARDWLRTAPAVIVCMADKTAAWVRPSDGKNHADVDIAIATEHLVLAAAEQGLGTCWVCNFDAPQLAAEFPVPEGFEVVALIPIGYPADAATQKKRKDASEIWQPEP